MPDEPSFREVEPTTVQLTRIEGTINLIKYQGEDMAKRMTHVEGNVEKLRTDVHTLQLEAVARDKLAVTVATTLKDKGTEEAANSERRWSPLTRLYIAGGTISYAVSIWLAIHK